MNTLRHKQLATEADIPSAMDKGIARLNFGNGLHMILPSGRQPYFLFRMSCQGRDFAIRLGTLTETTFAQARGLANEHRRSIHEKKRQKALTELKNWVKKGQNTDEATAFMSSLQFPLHAFLYKLNTARITEEVRHAIRLLLLIPAQPHDLLNARWEQFNSAEMTWRPPVTLKDTKSTFFQQTGIAYLSLHAKNDLTILHNLTSSSPFLFPSLAVASNNDRQKRLRESLHIVWPDAPIDPKEFRQLFKAWALKHSFFRAELINAVMHHHVKMSGAYLPPYITQCHALANWWSQSLEPAIRAGTADIRGTI